ncbi:MAG: translation initiation factor eIF-1A [Nanoarchaeota archaeon]|nr:translation initiation factor eIF-1A [Nanoarchaeota archaeon]
MVFNKFKDKSKANAPKKPQFSTEGPVRVKMPRGREILGIIEQRVGAARILVRCIDGKTRNCRVPGRLRRKLWLREGDIVILEPWEFDDGKGDVLFKYHLNQINMLRKRGMLKGLEDDF